jgi:hypothetical protein
MSSSSRSFLATIYKIWILRYVDVPEEIGSALAKEFRALVRSKIEAAKPKHIPVIAIVKGGSTRTTLVPAGGGRYRLQFNATLRKAAQADVGNVVSVGIKLDSQSRALPIPLEFEAALKHNRGARREFDRLPPGLRKQLLRMLLQVKSPEVLYRRIDRTVEILLARALRHSRKSAGQQSTKTKK